MVAANRSDSLGVAYLRRSGLKMVVLSTETNPVVAARCRKMQIPVVQGIWDKAAELPRIMAEFDAAPERTIYVGNDINDVPCFALVGCAVAVADAQPAARRAADIVLSRNGGHGAVRELLDILMRRMKG